MDDIDVQDTPDAQDATLDADEREAILQEYLAEKYGDDYDLNNLDQWAKEKKGWLSKENSQNQARLQAQREAEAARDKLVAELSARDRELASGSNVNKGSGELTEGSFYQHLGLKDADDVLTARQAFGLWQAASQYMVAQQGVYGQEFGKVHKTLKELDVTKQEFEEMRTQVAESLATSFEREVLGKHPDADPKAIREAISEAPDGDDFESYVYAAAQESEKRIRSLASKAKTGTATRVQRARKIHTGTGPAGAVARKRPPSILTNEGLADFAARTYPALAGGEDT
jgi:hypothetical protein